MYDKSDKHSSYANEYYIYNAVLPLARILADQKKYNEAEQLYAKVYAYEKRPSSNSLPHNTSATVPEYSAFLRKIGKSESATAIENRESEDKTANERASEAP
jgi:hypothetical protein